MKLICIVMIVSAPAVIACSLILNRIMFRTVKYVNQQNCHERYTDKNSRISFRSGKNLLTGFLYGFENKSGLVIISPGMGVTSDYYIPEALWLAEHGYMVMTFDNTAYRNNPGHFRGISQAVCDLRAAVHFAEQYGLPITLFGHSMGGYAVCAVLNYADVTVDGINRSDSRIVIAQGKNDEEVSCDTVSIYGKQKFLRKSNIQYLLFDHGTHSTHMGIVRGDTDEMINENLLKYFM